MDSIEFCLILWMVKVNVLCRAFLQLGQLYTKLKVIFLPYQVSPVKLILSIDFHCGNKQNVKKYPKTHWGSSTHCFFLTK